MGHRNFFALAALCSLATGAILLTVYRHGSSVLASPQSVPAYDKSGNLLAPANYREWIYLTSGIDMSYSSSASPDHSIFDNVFVNPEAYREFLKTGTWPDKTVMVLEVREAKGRGSINLRGHYQGTEVMGMEVHLKDSARFPGKWAFFGVDASKGIGTLIPPTADCYSCHSAHGAVDTTFVQFYPALLPLAQAKGTLSAEFLKESSAEAVKK